MKKVFIINNNYEIVEGWVDNVDETVYTNSVYHNRPRYVDSITSLRFKTEVDAKDYLIAFLKSKVLAVESKPNFRSKLA